MKVDFVYMPRKRSIYTKSTYPNWQYFKPVEFRKFRKLNYKLLEYVVYSTLLFSRLLSAPYRRHFRFTSLSFRHSATTKPLSNYMYTRDASARSPPSPSLPLRFPRSPSRRLLRSPSLCLLRSQSDRFSVLASLFLLSRLAYATLHRIVINILTWGKLIVIWPMGSASTRPSLRFPHFLRRPTPYSFYSTN